MWKEVKEKETGGEAVSIEGQIWGFSGLHDQRTEWKGGGRTHHLIRLVSIFLAVAVNAFTRGLLLLGQLGLGGQQGGEREEARGGGDGREGWLAQAQRQGGHGQGQTLKLRQLVSLKLLLYRKHQFHLLNIKFRLIIIISFYYYCFLGSVNLYTSNLLLLHLKRNTLYYLRSGLKTSYERQLPVARRKMSL